MARHRQLGYSYHHLFVLFISCLLLVYMENYFVAAQVATDVLIKGTNLTDGKTLVSASGTFTLGFFTPGVGTRRYLGIWFSLRNSTSDAVCWVANPERPLGDNFGVLFIGDTGSLVLLDGSGQSVWSSNTTGVASPTVQILESGNLVMQGSSDAVLWQSFDHPSNTLLPGMKVGRNLWNGANWFLRSWRTATDPSPGTYRYMILTQDLLEIVMLDWDGSVVYRTGVWNGLWFSGIPEMATYSDRFSYQATISAGEITYGYTAKAGAPLSRIVLMDTGVLQRLVWEPKGQAWKNFFQGPRDLCDTYAMCGPFGLCDANAASTSFCTCVKGFSAASPSDWDMRDRSRGCRRNVSLDCRNSTDGFATLHGVKLPDARNASVDMSITLDECRARCLANCSCVAYAAADIRRGGAGTGCIIWADSLIDLRRVDGGQDLYLRLARHELGPQEPPPGKPEPTWKKLVPILVPVFIIAFFLLTLAFLFCTGLLDWWNTWDNISRHSWAAATEQANRKPPVVDLATVKRATRNFSKRNVIGEGSFGIVHEGKLPRRHPLVQGLPGRTIAVKRLRSERGLPDTIVDYFTREVQVISGIAPHENVLQFLAYCEERNERILVYEYMHLKSLDVYIFGNVTKRALLGWERRLRIIIGVAKGIDHLSSENVIHRDLKPANVLLDDSWNAKVADFGTAKLLVPDATGTGTRIGTPGYMAPEYVQDEGQTTLKCDVYSFGITLLETLSGQKNYERNSEGTSLIAYAWRLWEARHERNIMALLDSAVASLPANSELVRQLSRCIQIGLLCVQGEARNRPSMSEVVEMLIGNINTDLTLPKGPMVNLPPLQEADTSMLTVYQTVNAVNLRWQGSNNARTEGSDHAGTSGVKDDLVSGVNDESSKLL